MTVLATSAGRVEAEAAEAGSAAPERSPSSDRWRLGLHSLALGLVLVVGLTVVGVDHVVSADEGAVLGQAKVVADSGSFDMTYWASSFDPDGRWFPFDLSTRHADGWHLYSKKPLYVWAVAGLASIGGRSGVVGGHVAALVAASVVAALISRRLGRGLEIPVLWATGVGSPLVVDGSWVIGHAPAAALVGAATLGALRWREGRSWGSLGLVAMGIIGATLLRNEATLFGLALAGCAALGALRRWCRRDVALSLAAFVATTSGLVLSAALQRHVEGTAAAGLYVIREEAGWVQARGLAVWNTLLAPQAPDGPIVAAWLGVVATAATAIGWSSPFRSARPKLAAMLGWAAVALIAARMVTGGFLVPGLLAAWPVGVAAISVGWPERRRIVGMGTGGLLGATALAYTTAVVATTYSSGGTGDWGARYVHLALPVAVPLAIALLAAARRRGGATTALEWSLLSVAVLMGLSGWLSFGRAEANVSRVVEDTRAMAVAAGGEDGPAVVVSTHPAFGRYSYEYATEDRYLTVDSRTGAIERQGVELGVALDRAGIVDVILTGPEDDLTELARSMSARYVAVRPWARTGETWRILSLRRR